MICIHGFANLIGDNRWLWNSPFVRALWLAKFSGVFLCIWTATTDIVRPLLHMAVAELWIRCGGIACAEWVLRGFWKDMLAPSNRDLDQNVMERISVMTGLNSETYGLSIYVDEKSRSYSHIYVFSWQRSNFKKLWKCRKDPDKPFHHSINEPQPTKLTN